MYNKEALHNILLKNEYRTVDEGGKALPPSNSVYEKISEAMQEKNSTISAKHVYTIVNANRGEMRDTICKIFSVKVNNLNISGDSSFNVSDRVSDSNCKSDKADTTTTKFKLIITSTSWNKIKPKAKICANRKYYILKAHRWTSLFAEKIWQQTKIRCAFSFKRAKVYRNDHGKCYAKFEANCKECDGHLVGFVYKKPPAKTDAVFHRKLAGSRSDVAHKKKRHLKGYLREKIAQNMVAEGKRAATWRITEANRIMDFGDSVPPILFSADVLRKAKQLELEKQLQISSTDPVHNLHTAKYTTVPNTIHVLSNEPFICIYWLQEQHAMYGSAYKYDGNSYLVIDATGSIGKKLILPDGSRSQHIFLYQCVYVSKMGNFPAFQCVSAAQDAATIAYFLFQVARHNPPPRIVVSDFGLAILIAVARAFCDTDLRQYLKSCHRVAVLNELDMVPKCFIRLDVSHFIAMIARWPSLKGKLPRVRQFYLRCAGRAYQLQSFNEVEELLKSVLVVALSENIGVSENDKKLPSEDFLQIASHHIRGIETQADENEEEADELPGTEEDDESSSWKQWAAALHSTADEISQGCKHTGFSNPYYNPEAAKRLKNLMGYLPLWTGIMRRYFKCEHSIASSSYVEAEFSKLKDYFKGQLPMRIDKFVLRHIDYLRGTLRLVSSECCGDGFGNTTDDGIPNKVIADRTFDASTSIDVEGNDTCSRDCSTLDNESHGSVYSGKGGDSDKENDTGNGITEGDNMTESLNTCEDWKGKTNPNTTETCNILQVAKRSKPNYLDPFPEWDAARYEKAVLIPIMQNGNLCGPVLVGDKKRIIVIETCAFDSLLQISVNAIVTRPVYNNTIEKTNNVLHRLATDIFTTGKLTTKHYAQRAIILRTVPFLQLMMKTRHVESINAKCNVGHLAEHLYLDVPSYTVDTNCTMCQTVVETRPFSVLNVNVNILLQEGCHYMQQAIDDARIIRAPVCKKCGTDKTVETTFGPQVIIDTSVFSHDDYLSTMNVRDAKCSLNSISKLIEIEKLEYVLAGLAHYQRSNEHYMAYAWTGTQWHVYDDVKKNRETADGGTYVLPHIFMYVRNVDISIKE